MGASLTPFIFLMRRRLLCARSCVAMTIDPVCPRYKQPESQGAECETAFISRRRCKCANEEEHDQECGHRVETIAADPVASPCCAHIEDQAADENNQFERECDVDGVPQSEAEEGCGARPQ